MVLIYLDSCIVVYLVERDARRLDVLRAWLSEAGDMRLCVSPLVKTECLVQPLRLGRTALVEAYARWFDEVETVLIDEECFLNAARLRARHGIKLPDALHLATAVRHGCLALWTNDGRMASAGGGIVRALDEPSSNDRSVD